MKLRLAVLAVVSATALSACGVTAAPATAPTATTDAAEPNATTPAASSGMGDSVKDSGDIPDPCTLLSDTEVKELTGRAISQTDHDGEKTGATTRFCQWQQPSGQLAIFLSRTTESDFTTVIEGAEPVDGVGEDAFSLAGHLYVLYGTVSIDVYSRGDSDEQNIDKAREIAKVLISRV
ncbi:hypothetical protein GCM10010435_07560 [Winogradskya consettensis]|uniref:DUF3558 domain-containing protein n=1 Tax=Winogradskya consettensis TaxID=113560 RepID=A0A919SQJ2_9ACTN|nr:DUF3558 family protein [Actinoplanes consettensis]GIM75707.1 hypothetical protein Aco04nite_46680 [Actinoplanes consettensis]